MKLFVIIVPNSVSFLFKITIIVNKSKILVGEKFVFTKQTEKSIMTSQIALRVKNHSRILLRLC